MDKVVLTILIVASFYFFARPLRQRLLIVAKGKGAISTDPPGPRIGRWISEVLFQSKVIRERPFAGVMHALVFWGFLAFALESLDHFVHGYGGSFLGDGAFHAGFSWIVAIFAILVLIGILSLALRRFIVRPESLGHFSSTSLIVVFFISILMVTFFLAQFTFEEGTTAATVNWWVHAVVLLAFLPLIVRSKHLHLVLSPVTTFTKDLSLVALKPLDFEKEEFGAESLADLQKHTLLGAFTCVECGRCHDQCPAQNTGKALDPKELMLALRRGILADVTAEAVRDDLVTEEVIWQCTTCGACTYQCPVGIDQVIPIIDLRRGKVANSVFPETMMPLFKNLETAGNPWGYPPHTAGEFIEESGFPKFDGQPILYWMGCLARFDDRYKKVGQAFARVLNAAGIEWGVLADERCTGDAARRAGNEFLFTMIAEQNIEMLNAAAPAKIVSTCPHCVWTLNEYREFGLSEKIEIEHHSQFIADLIWDGKIKSPVDAAGERTAYHDACYLSRYQDPVGSQHPRQILGAMGACITEPRRTGSQSFCCGAGGGMLFTEETAGTRINHERVGELLETGAKTFATACPFCRMMLEDGLADKGQEGIPVKDLAQVVAETLDP